MSEITPLADCLLNSKFSKQNGEVIRAAHVPLNSSATKAVFSPAEINLIFIKAKKNYILGG